VNASATRFRRRKPRFSVSP